MPRTAIAVLGACACVFGEVDAQGSQGPFVGMPLHFSVGPATQGPGGSPLATNQLYLKRAGFTDLLVAPPYSPTRPEFTMAAMFGSPPPGFRVDAMSSGYCTVFCSFLPSGQAVLTIPPGAWGALLFSVTNTSLGTPGTVVATETSSVGGAGADVFSLVLPGSTLPAELAACVPIGEAQRANDSTEMGFSSATPPELGDFDPFFSFYEVEGSLATYLVPEPWVYFSIHVPAAGLPVPVQNWVALWFASRSGPPLLPPNNQISGATILRTKWLSTATPPQWSQPEVFLSFQELGLNIGDDIDALAVDETGLLALSLRRTPARMLLGEQLMVAAFSWNTVLPWSYPTCTRTARPYLYDDGTDAFDPLARKAGADGGGDLDAICETDPSAANGITARGFPYVKDCRAGFPYAVPMSASIFPTLSVAPTTTSLVASVSGIPTSLTALGVLLADTPISTAPATLAYPQFVEVWPVTGSKHNTSINVAALPAGYGVDLELQYFTIDITGTISLSNAVRLRM